MRTVSLFITDDRGSQTIEFVLWIPLITAMLMIVVDASTLYLTHTEMTVVARDTARRMTTGRITSAREAEAFAASSTSLRDFPYRVRANYDPMGSMEVTLTMDFADMSIIGYSPLAILGGTMQARVAMKSPPILASLGGTSGPGGKGSGGGSGNGNGNGGGSGNGNGGTGGNGNGNGGTGGNGNGNGGTGGSGGSGGNGGTGSTGGNGNGNGGGNGNGNGTGGSGGNGTGTGTGGTGNGNGNGRN